MYHTRGRCRHARQNGDVGGFDEAKGVFLLCRQEAEEHERAMDVLESALEEAKSQAHSKEQKLLIATKELKVA